MNLIQTDNLTEVQLKALKKLATQVEKHDGGLPSIDQALITQKRPLPSHFLLFADKEHLIGFASLYLFHTPEITLFIHPNYHHQEITQILFDKIRALCVQEHLSHFLCASVFSPLPDWMINAALHHAEYQMIKVLETPLVISQQRLQIQKATQAMVTNLCEIDKACFTDNNPDMVSRFNTLIENSAYLILVALYQGSIIGKVHLHLHKKEAILSDLSILPHFQRQGLGLELLKHAINQTIMLGLKKMHLEVESPSLVLFYQKAGFLVVKKEYFYQYSGML